jgi:hypothetical protein
MKNLTSAIRLAAFVGLVFAALATGTPQPAQAQMSCREYCKTVCLANGETCCWITSNTCGCC